MPYHPLSSDSAQSPERRREEATQLVANITSLAGSSEWEKLSDKEQGFIEQMEDEAQPVSVKQLFWLRDLWEKLG